MTGRITGIQQERALRVCFAAVGRGAPVTKCRRAAESAEEGKLGEEAG